MALKRYRLFSNLIILTAITVALPSIRARAAGAPPAGSSLPSLQSFAVQLENGNASELRGVYVNGLFALPVAQQPAGDSAFISTQPDVLTQFATASGLGSTGILAHNYLAGSLFPRLKNRQFIYLVYGDGRTVAYVVKSRQRFQALQPDSPYSAFIDLSTGRQTGAYSLFTNIYGRSGALVLQTCIDAEGLSTWGRLFIIAVPQTDQMPPFRSGPYPL